MAHHLVSVDGTDLQFRCRDDENVLVGMRYHGADGIQVGCRGGGCGVCRVQVLSGTFTAKKMSKAHVSEADLAQNIVLSCRIFATSDLSVRACPKPQATSQPADAPATEHLTNQ